MKTDDMITLIRLEIEVVVEIRVRARQRAEIQLPNASPLVIPVTYALVPPAPGRRLPPSLGAGQQFPMTASEQGTGRAFAAVAVLIMGEGGIHYAAAFSALSRRWSSMILVIRNTIGFGTGPRFCSHMEMV